MDEFSAKGGPASSWDLVTVGGATVDLFLLIDSSNPHFKFNKDTNELSMRLGDKIVLDNAKFTVGGNAANVSVGLKRLGFQTSIFAEMGDDEFADRILRTLNKEGVGTKKLTKGKAPTSFSIVINYAKDRTIFTEKPEREHNFSFNGLKTDWIYLTSLGEKWHETYREVNELVKKKRIKLAFNPGTAQLDKGLGSFGYLLPNTEVLIVNKEEGIKMANKQSLRSDDLGSKEDAMKDLLFELKKLGPKIVVVTDGENGSHAINEVGEIFFEEAIKVKIFSRTGAGDAYSSGLLAGLMSDKSLKEAMLWGTKNAASVIKLIGAQAGLLTREDIGS